MPVSPSDRRSEIPERVPAGPHDNSTQLLELRDVDMRRVGGMEAQWDDAAWGLAVRPSSQIGQWCFAALIAVATIVLIAPLWRVASFPMQDGPSHFAELYLLLHAGSDPLLSHFYQVEWAPVPDLAGELIIWALSGVFSLLTSVRLFLSLGVLFWTVGPALIQRALFGRLNAASLIAAAFAYNAAFVTGFWNFYFALGFCFPLVALWIAWPKRSGWRTAFFAAAFTTVYFFHFLAMLGLLFMLGGYEASRARRASQPRQARWGLVLQFGMLLLPAALLSCLRPHVAGAGAYKWALIQTFPERIASVLQTGLGQSQWYIALVPLLLLFWGMRRRTVLLHPDMRPLLIVLAVLCLFLPTVASGGWGMHVRFPAMGLALLFAASEIRLPRVAHGVLVGAAAMLVLGLGVALDANWQRFDAQMTEFRGALQQMPPGSKMFIAQNDDAGSQAAAYWHMDSYAITDRQSFDTLLFTTRGQHIVHPTSGYETIAALSSEEGSPALLSELSRLRLSRTHDRDEMRFHRNELDWPCRFDVMALIDPSGTSPSLPNDLELIHRGSFFSLSRVRKPSRCTRETNAAARQL